MSILIIGNGFDLAHHLPTQYSDFLDFIKACKEPDDSIYSSFIDEIKKTNKNLYLEIQELINSNKLLEYFLSIYQERCKEGKKGWIDFESEISVIVQKFDEAKQDVEKKYSISTKPAKLERRFAKYLNPIITVHREPQPNVIYGESEYEPQFFDYQASIVWDALNQLTRLLEIYLYEYVEKKSCQYRLPDLSGLEIDQVLSFNYTDTYRKLYDPESKAQYCYIHGKTQRGKLETCSLVLGINEYLSPERKDSDNQFIWFKKFYQRIYKKTGSEYLDWISHFEDFNKKYKKASPSHMEIYVYGHSLDVTDKDVLLRLFLMENTTTHIFYHNRESMAKLISNLVKVIGEDNLIKMTGGRDRTIQFIQSKPAIEIM